MKYIRELPSVDELCEQYSITADEIKKRNIYINSIKKILSGDDSRKLIIVGPCSADRKDAVLEYTCRLRELSDKVSDRLFIVPRVYTGKPRTSGAGYKGMIHSPDASSKENLMEGVIAARDMHISVIRETGMFPADEMLYTEEICYLCDVIGYLAVGARSVEDQAHRMLASDDTIPVGLKNPTGGSKISLINSIKATQISHRMMYRGWEVETKGNQYGHAILRGFTNKSGKNHSNYHYEDIVELHDMCVKNNINNPGVIIDCNHANSDKKYYEEPRIAHEVMGYCKYNPSINHFVKGIMIESYLEDGAQIIGQGIYGKSITDPCLGWTKTEKLILEIAEY